MIIPGATATRVCLYSLFKWWAQISGDFKSYEAEITEKTTASVVKNSDCKNGHPLLPGLYGASVLHTLRYCENFNRDFVFTFTSLATGLR